MPIWNELGPMWKSFSELDVTSIRDEAMVTPRLAVIGSSQKAGVLPDQADVLIASARDVHGLNVEGLMCIPPADEAPEPHFRLLAEIAARNGLLVLSMGMSGDYETAISNGATHVRVGSALFGERIAPLKPS